MPSYINLNRCPKQAVLFTSPLPIKNAFALPLFCLSIVGLVFQYRGIFVDVDTIALHGDIVLVIQGSEAVYYFFANALAK